MKKTVFVFSALIVALLVLFQLGKYSYVSGNLSIEIGIAVVAVVFFIIGIYINKRTLNHERKTSNPIDSEKIEKLGISKREYQVLVCIS
ncbi:MAG: DNA-binding response regulator, partial [Allomuricauda sp.]